MADMGFAFDDEMNYSGDSEPAGVPDEQADQDSFFAMESALNELVDLAKDIQGARGMSQRFAMEAERIMPGIITTSLNYFTVAPSATKLATALEEINHGIWALIAAGVAVVIAAIYKIWRWLAGDKSSDDSGKPSGSSEAAAAKLGEKVTAVSQQGQETMQVAEGMLDVSRQIHSQPIKFTGKDGHEVKFNSMDQLIDALFVDEQRFSEERKFILNPDPVQRDIVNNGPYTKLFEEIVKAGVLRIAEQTIAEKIKLLEEIEHKDRNGSGTIVPGAQGQLDLIAKPITVTFKGKMLTLKELAVQLSNARETAAGQTNNQRMHFDDMFHKIASVYKNKDTIEILTQMIDYLPALSSIKSALQKTEDYIGDLTQDGAPGGNTPQVAQRIRGIISVLNDQLHGYGALANEVEHYLIPLRRLSNVTTGFAKEIVRKMDIMMKAAEVTDIPLEWRQVRAGIEGVREAMEKSHYPSGFHNHKKRFNASLT